MPRVHDPDRWGMIQRVGRALVLVAGLCASSLWGGCNIVTPLAGLAGGPPMADAQYVLADVPTVVFVDDRANHLDPNTLRRVIADKISQDLMSNKALTMTISPQDAMLLASRNDRARNLMNIQEIGKAVGAQQIVYVEIATFEDTPDGYTPRPTAQANVKVIDVAAGQRVFPDANAPRGWSVHVNGAPADPSLFASRSSRLKIHESLANDLGYEVARLFYRHEIKELGTRVGGQH